MLWRKWNKKTSSDRKMNNVKLFIYIFKWMMAAGYQIFNS